MTIRFIPDPKGIRQLKDAIFDGTEETAEAIKEHGKDLAFFGQYATGETKQSIAQETFWTKLGVRFKVFTQSGHGGFVEAGTKHNKAEPFLYPAFQRTINQIFENIKKRLP